MAGWTQWWGRYWFCRHFFVLWYWIDVSPAIVKMLISKKKLWKLNNLLVLFSMKPHYYFVGLLEHHQCQCKWEGISNTILYRDNRNSHGLWFTFIEWKSKEYWSWNTNLWVEERKCQLLTDLNYPKDPWIVPYPLHPNEGRKAKSFLPLGLLF